MAQGKPKFAERDVGRVIRAARRAGLTAYRLEIKPDGTIMLTPTTSSEPTGDLDQWMDRKTAADARSA
jgi:hypothetical protein